MINWMSFNISPYDQTLRLPQWIDLEKEAIDKIRLTSGTVKPELTTTCL